MEIKEKLDGQQRQQCLSLILHADMAFLITDLMLGVGFGSLKMYTRWRVGLRLDFHEKWRITINSATESHK